MPDDRPGGTSATMNIRLHPERDADANRFPDPTASREKILDEWSARMRQRWAAGERVSVETFLAEFPHLVEDTQALFALLLEEYDLRDQQGSPPTLDEIRTRFPSLVRPLEQYSRHRQALQRVPEPISEDAQTLDVPAHSSASRGPAWRSFPGADGRI